MRSRPSATVRACFGRAALEKNREALEAETLAFMEKSRRGRTIRGCARPHASAAEAMWDRTQTEQFSQ
jgi:hypothetical protein